MLCTKANDKSLKISGTHLETGNISLFLIRSSSNDCNKLAFEIESRIRVLKNLEEKEKNKDEDEEKTDSVKEEGELSSQSTGENEAKVDQTSKDFEENLSVEGSPDDGQAKN